MGVTDQKVNTSSFDHGLKKPNKALTISKKNLFLIGFVVITLQVADTGILWLMGLNSHSSGDSFVFSAIVFAILKCTYDKCTSKGGKVREAEKAPTEEEEDCRKSATYVVDTKFRNQFRFREPLAPKKTQNTGAQPEQDGCGVGCGPTIWVSSWWRPQCLNPKATKFTPLHTYWKRTLNSNSQPFWPQETVKKEKELLKSESGGSDAGEVVYRSSHWLTEIGFENKQKEPPKTLYGPKRSHWFTKAAMVKYKRQEPQQSKWVPKSSQPC